MRFLKFRYFMVGLALALALGVAGAAYKVSAKSLTVPEGTALHVRFDHSLSTNQHRSGDGFTRLRKNSFLAHADEDEP